MFRRHLAFATALTLALPTFAWAATPQFGGQAVVQFGSQNAYREGYDRGVRAGDLDARRGERFRFDDESDYRRGDIGYQSQFGSRERYRDDFRRGFESGYRTGYSDNNRRDDRIPSRSDSPYFDGRPGVGSYGRTDAAANNGYNDGYREGLNDGRARHRFDPVAESRYRSGDHGYERAFGSKERYQNVYRDAFRNGYGTGYRDGARY
jgi:hypothetical protein